MKTQKARTTPKIFLVLFSLIFCILLVSGTASQMNSTFSLHVGTEQVTPGSEVQVQIHLTPGVQPVGAFLADLTYDSSVFSLLNVKKTSQLSGSDFSIATFENRLRILYVCDVSQGSAPYLSGTLVTLVFTVQDDAPQGIQEFSFSVKQLSNFDGDSLKIQDMPGSAKVEIVSLSDSSSQSSEPASEEPAAPPKLTALTPSVGELSPGFDPDVLSYDLTVPASCDQVTFSVAPQNAQIYTEINRTTLNTSGDTLISITVRSVNDSSLKTEYTVVVHRDSESESEAPAAAAQLLQLRVHTPAGAELTPDFSPDVFLYHMTVPEEVSEVLFEYEATPGAAVVVSRRNLESAGSDTIIDLTVSSLDDVETKYRVIVTRQPSEETPEEEQVPKLDALSVQAPANCTLTPAFSQDVLQYELYVPAEVSEVTFDYGAERGIVVEVSRSTLNRAGSDTPITITASNLDGAKTVYSVIVHRRLPEETSSQPEEELPTQGPQILSLTIRSPSNTALTPDFSPDVFQYNVEVPAEVSEVTFDYERASDVAVTINRSTLEPAGGDTIILLTATDAENAKSVYRVIVHRALAEASETSEVPETPEAGDTPDVQQGPQLESLAVHSPSGTALTPAFSPDIYQYALTVPSDVSEVTFDYAAKSGVAVEINRTKLQNTGDTTILLTAEDAAGAETVYRVIVHRQPAEIPQERVSQPPKLLALSSDKGTLSPAFSSNVFEYTMTVPASTTILNFTYQAEKGAAVSINRTSLKAAGSDTEITLTVSNAEGDQTKYRVIVHRQPAEVVAGTNASTTHKGDAEDASASESASSMDESVPAEEKTEDQIPVIISDDDTLPSDQDLNMWVFLILALVVAVAVCLFVHGNRTKHDNPKPPSQQS